MKEVDALAGEGIDIIALDATQLTRPDGSTFADFFKKVKKKYPEQLFMADCSTVEEGIEAEKAGVDFVGTTLVGYTDHSKGDVPLETLESMLQSVSVPVIAEGNMDTPEKAARALALGSHAVVVGSAIRRPQLIKQKFRDAIDKEALDGGIRLNFEKNEVKASIRLEQAKRNFTKSELKIYDYIYKNPAQVLYHSLTELAEACNVGEATVLRLFRKI